MPITKENNKDLFMLAQVALIQIELTHENANNKTAQRKIANDQLQYTKKIFELVLEPPKSAGAVLRKMAELEWYEPWAGKKTSDIISDQMSYELVKLLNQLCKILLENKEEYFLFISKMSTNQAVVSKVRSQFDKFILKQTAFEKLLQKYEKEHSILRIPIPLPLELRTDPVVIVTIEEQKQEVSENGEVLENNKQYPNCSTTTALSQNRHLDLKQEEADVLNQDLKIQAVIEEKDEHKQDAVIETTSLKNEKPGSSLITQPALSQNCNLNHTPIEAEVKEMKSNLQEHITHLTALTSKLRTELEVSLQIQTTAQHTKLTEEAALLKTLHKSPFKILKDDEIQSAAALRQQMKSLENTKKQKIRQFNGFRDSSLNKLFLFFKDQLDHLSHNTGCVDFGLLESQLNNPALYTELLHQPLVDKHSNFNTLLDVLRVQSDGFWGFLKSQPLSPQNLQAALNAVVVFLKSKVDEFFEQHRQCMEFIDTTIEILNHILVLSEQIPQFLDESSFLQINVEQNQRQLDVLIQIAQYHDSIFNLKETIEKLEQNDFKQYLEDHLEEIETLLKKPYLGSALDFERQPYFNELISLLKSTEKALITQFNWVNEENQKQLKQLELKLEDCRQSTECIKIMEDIETLVIQINKHNHNEKKILELIPESELKKVHQKKQDQLSQRIRNSQHLTFNKLLALWDNYKKALALYDNPTEAKIEQSILEIEFIKTELELLYHKLEVNNAIQEHLEADRIELHRIELLNRNFLNTARKKLVHPCIAGLDAYLSAQPEVPAGRMTTLIALLKDFAEKGEPTVAAAEKIVIHIKTTLPSVPMLQTKEMLHKISLALLDYNQFPVEETSVKTKLLQLGESNQPYYNALVKLYAHIDALRDHAQKLSLKNNKAEASVPHQLAEGLKQDLNRFVAKERPDANDWARLNDCFGARLGSEESSLSKHRSVWKQILASLFTLGGYLGYQAKQSYYKTGQVRLFTTERQNKLEALKSVAKTELEQIKQSCQIQ